MRGLKGLSMENASKQYSVASHRDAWIKGSTTSDKERVAQSYSTGMCGLKEIHPRITAGSFRVASFAGCVD